MYCDWVVGVRNTRDTSIKGTIHQLKLKEEILIILTLRVSFCELLILLSMTNYFIPRCSLLITINRDISVLSLLLMHSPLTRWVTIDFKYIREKKIWKKKQIYREKNHKKKYWYFSKLYRIVFLPINFNKIIHDKIQKKKTCLP